MTATVCPSVALPVEISIRPNHSTSIIPAFTISIMSGAEVSVSRKAPTVDFISSPLDAANRAISWFMRTNTRISRMPVRFS
ncbi:hypothetical protein D3C73_1184440 [compost metagenome]